MIERKIYYETIIYETDLRTNTKVVVDSIRRGLRTIQQVDDKGRICSEVNYNTEGKLVSTANYVNGCFTSLTTGCKIEYSNFKKNGKSESIMSSGVKEVAYYKDGVLHGPRREYYTSGVIRLESNYVDGKLQGLYELFWETGLIKMHCFFSQDKLHGFAENYNNEGKLILRKNYIHGILHGLYETWFDDGEFKFSAEFVNGITEKYRSSSLYDTLGDNLLN